jgi:hypothetical protein
MIDVFLLFRCIGGIALFQVLIALAAIFVDVPLVFSYIARVFVPVNAVLIQVALA